MYNLLYITIKLTVEVQSKSDKKAKKQLIYLTCSGWNQIRIAQSAGTIEYTDCTSAER